VLDALDELNVEAHFFLVGRNVVMYPQAAQEIVARGHSVGTHSFTHRNMVDIGQAAASNEFSMTSDAVMKIMGVQPFLWRPPFGEATKATMDIIHAATGLEVAMWNFDTKDWEITEAPDGSDLEYLQEVFLQKIFQAYISTHKSEPNSLSVLAHDAKTSKENLKAIVNFVRSKGYEFVDMQTCYNQWVQDGKREAPCAPECPTFLINGVCPEPIPPCVQASTGAPIACVPDGSLCVDNPCGSPGCGLSCDTGNLCDANGKLKVCVPDCNGRTCGADGCGGSCGKCGAATCSVSGQCSKIMLPDLQSSDLCRPVYSDRPLPLTLKSSIYMVDLVESLSATYTLLSQWDEGLSFKVFLENPNHPNYCIKDFSMRVTNAPDTYITAIYGFTNVTSMDSIWSTVTIADKDSKLEMTGKTEVQIMLSRATSNPLKMSCFPVKFEVIKGSATSCKTVTTSEGNHLVLPPSSFLIVGALLALLSACSY
jgi:hypothetical protein